MPQLLTSYPIIALLYHVGRDVDPVMRRVADELSSRGHSLAGFIQRDEGRPDRPRCDMILVDLAGGSSIRISEDRGVSARGCRLDTHELLQAMSMAREAMTARPDLLIVNKFGKSESEGGGFRDLIAEAVEQGVPCLVAVPWRNIDSWRRFAGGLAIEHRLEDLPTNCANLCHFIGLRSLQAFGDGVDAAISP